MSMAYILSLKLHAAVSQKIWWGPFSSSSTAKRQNSCKNYFTLMPWRHLLCSHIFFCSGLRCGLFWTSLRREKARVQARGPLVLLYGSNHLVVVAVTKVCCLGERLTCVGKISDISFWNTIIILYENVRRWTGHKYTQTLANTCTQWAKTWILVH
jgi:hypothetical protein